MALLNRIAENCGISWSSTTLKFIFLLNDKSATTNTTTTNASAAPAARNVVEIKVNAKDFEYDKKVINVKKGDKVKITLHNDNGSHGLAIPDYNVHIQGNGSAEFTANIAGTFEFHCSVMCGSGHSNMIGKLIVQ